MKLPIALALSLVPALALADKPPKQVTAQQALLRAPGALDHLRAFAVDEKCFPDNALEGKDTPHGASLSKDKDGDKESVSLTLDGPSRAPLAKFKTWVATKFKKTDRTFGYSPTVMANMFYGYHAECLITPAVLDHGEIGHVTNKLHPEIDKADYRLAFPAASIAKLKKLPAGTLRIAFVYDDDNILTNFAADMDLTEATVISLYKL